MPLKAALGAFLTELDRFESDGIRLALRALAHDAAFAEQSERLLGLDARLTLLERLAGARPLPAGVATAFADVVVRARRLLGLRDAIVRVPADVAASDLGTPPLIVRHRAGSPLGRFGEPDALWIPGAQQLDAYTSEAAELNSSLRALAPDLGRA